ncbi:MAG TPA: copper resistance protein CopC [Herbaspirillum sp.]|jgi:copper transport protein
MIISSMVRRVAKLAGIRCALALLLFAALQMMTTGAFAHASLIETQPSDGAMLRTAPADVTLRFNEPVAPLVFKLLLPDGSIRPLTQNVTVPDGLKLSLPNLSASGTYLVSWRVVSADGHPVGGSVTYSVGVRSNGNEAAAAAALSPAASGFQADSQTAAIWLTRLGLYLALFIGVGAALFWAFVSSAAAPPVRWTIIVVVAGLVLLLLAVGLQGLDALALPWGALRTWQPWQTSLGTAYGLTAWLIAAALIAACVARMATRGWRRIFAIAAVLLLGAALAASGHASSAPPQWLARPAVFIHVMMIAAWAGSLLPLFFLLRDDGDDKHAGAAEAAPATAALLRFSRLIPWVMFLLVLSGGTLVLLQVDSIHAFWSTNYGRILSAKLIVVSLLLAIAAFNRYALTERAEQGDLQARRSMRRLIGVELGLVLLVLALVATWRFTPPPRALAAAHPVPLNVHMHGQQAMVDLTLTAQKDHGIRAGLFVQTGDFGPLDAKEVSLQFSNPALGIEPLQKDAHRGADTGSWVVEPFALPAAGHWHVRVDVLISDFDSTALEQDIDIAF